MGQKTSFVVLNIRGAKRKQVRELLTSEELEFLCDDYYNQHEDRLKEYLVLCFTAFQALRIAEINRISLDDIDLRKGTIKMPSSKKIRARTLVLQPAQIGSLMLFLKDNDSFKICNNRKDTLFRILRKSDRKFQDFKQVRSSVITVWIKKYGLRKAQYLSGHKYIGSNRKTFGWGI